jgi:hypothetical protein
VESGRFFEKKRRKKLLLNWTTDVGRSRLTGAKFFVSFFKKEALQASTVPL